MASLPPTDGEEIYTIIVTDDGQEYILDRNRQWQINIPTPLTNSPEHPKEMPKQRRCKKQRPMSRYNAFMQKTMRQIVQDQPQLSGQERMHLAASLWKRQSLK